jgi:hypothetical protein
MYERTLIYAKRSIARRHTNFVCGYVKITSMRKDRMVK